MGDDASPRTTAAVTTYTYDPLTFRLVDLVTMRSSTAIQSLHYTYDAVGNITKVADAALQTVFYSNAAVGPDQTFTYDALRRLISATGREHSSQVASAPGYDSPVPLAHPNDGAALARYEETFTYDAVGNILEVAHTRTTSPGTGWTRTYEYETDVSDNPLSNRLVTTTPSGHSYTYDAVGRMTSMAHLPTMEWTWAGDLQHAARSGGEPSTGGDAYYQYAAPAAKARKVYEFSSGSRERRYLGSTELYRRFAGTTKKFERWTIHIDDGQGRIGLVERRTLDVDSEDPHAAADRIRYQLSNHLGTATTELDETGAVISYEEFHPYGTVAYSATDSSLAGHGRKRYRYTGKERDEDIGLNYHGARWYADWLGRWVSSDPAGLVDGPNTYAYVRGNPVGRVDLTGTREDLPSSYTTSDGTRFYDLLPPKVATGGASDGKFDPSGLNLSSIDYGPIDGLDEKGRVSSGHFERPSLGTIRNSVSGSARSELPFVVSPSAKSADLPPRPGPPPAELDGWGVAKAFLRGVVKGAVTGFVVTAVVVAGLASSPAVAVATALVASAAIAQGVIEAAREAAAIWTGKDAAGRQLSTQERAERIAEAAGSAIGAGVGGSLGARTARGGSGQSPDGQWKTPEAWAEHDHGLVRDRVRNSTRGYESGRHNEYPKAMREELTRMAKEADATGILPEYGAKLRAIAKTYWNREGTSHRGGGKGSR